MRHSHRKVWRTLKPSAVSVQGNIARVRFNMPAGGKLVLDSTLVGLATNYGFNVYDSAGTEITISSVSVSGPDTVKIVTATALPTTWRLDYVQTSTTAVNSNDMPYRGNVRDNAGDALKYVAAGNYPMHNWSEAFSKTVTNGVFQ